MKANHSFIHYSLLAAGLIMVPMTVCAAMRIGNHSRSYAEAYQQVNALRNQTATMGTVAAQPLSQNVAGTNNENVITNQNDTVVQDEEDPADACPMIYPNGEITWDNPNIGAGAGGAKTCVAVVELVGYQAAKDGSDLVLARANLAFGDTIRCNIDSFPESTIIASAVENFYFPTDNPPTMNDVIIQMNQEQKQNAGLKIAAGALIGGLGGNMAGENDPGKESLLGKDKGKIQGSVIGALSGAALMAGNVYAGKVAGDVILSTGVNAAAGGVVGNMAQTGNTVLRVEDCTLPLEGGGEYKTTCLWGAVATTDDGLQEGETAYYNIDDGTTYVCTQGDNEKTNCKVERLLNISLEAYPNVDISDVKEEMFEKILNDPNKQYYMTKNDDGTITFNNTGDSANGTWAKINHAERIKQQFSAMIEMRDKAFGLTSDDWDNYKSDPVNSNQKVYGRSTTGAGFELTAENITIKNFYPMEVSDGDGGLIDFGNKARLKSTLIGAGIGGALGGFTAYQGAQLDVQNRWTTAMREYEDSLSKVYCRTGNRWLSRYNDDLYIPASLEITTGQ